MNKKKNICNSEVEKMLWKLTKQYTTDGGLIVEHMMYSMGSLNDNKRVKLPYVNS